METKLDKNKSILTFFISGTGNHEEENELSEIEEILQNELTQNDDEDLRDPKPIFSFLKNFISRRRTSHDERFSANVNDPKPFKPIRWIKRVFKRRRGTVIVHRRTGSRIR